MRLQKAARECSDKQVGLQTCMARSLIEGMSDTFL